MNFIVTEIQTDANGNTATINTVRNNRNDAESTYYSILASAAISQVPCHGAIFLYTMDGAYIMSKSYQRWPEPEPEPEPNQE